MISPSGSGVTLEDSLTLRYRNRREPPRLRPPHRYASTHSSSCMGWEKAITRYYRVGIAKKCGIGAILFKAMPTLLTWLSPLP
ncbi:MAG: hypothetical protein V7K40_29535 [Nostoc sp.]|uniref:hypothetical protein n=1 Tax=Nostoc sp. TaxID=1180 RepID=UPI002FF97B11